MSELFTLSLSKSKYVFYIENDISFKVEKVILYSLKIAEYCQLFVKIIINF